jgi:hypothetical protein
LTNYRDSKKNADELFEAGINLIMNLYSVSDIRNACASALSNIDQIGSMKIGENLLLKMHHRLSFLFSSFSIINHWVSPKMFCQ